MENFGIQDDEELEGAGQSQQNYNEDAYNEEGNESQLKSHKDEPSIN